MRTGKSEAQANAEALARRSSTYADEHAASWQVAFDRPTHEPKSLRGYVTELRDAYEAECPIKLHTTQVDGIGQAFASAFEAWLDGDTHASPFRACLTGMSRAQDERTRKRSRIVGRVTMGGLSAIEAAEAEGVPGWCADLVAYDALRVTWRRYNSTPIARGLPKAEAAA